MGERVVLLLLKGSLLHLPPFASVLGLRRIKIGRGGEWSSHGAGGVTESPHAA